MLKINDGFVLDFEDYVGNITITVQFFLFFNIFLNKLDSCACRCKFVDISWELCLQNSSYFFTLTFRAFHSTVFICIKLFVARHKHNNGLWLDLIIYPRLTHTADTFMLFNNISVISWRKRRKPTDLSHITDKTFNQ